MWSQGRTILEPAFRIGVLTERRDRKSLQPAGLVRALGRAGHEVDLLVADDLGVWTDVSVWDAYDVVVLRGHGPAVLGAAYAAEASGVTVLNPPAAVAAVAQRPSLSTGELRVHGIGGQMLTLRRPNLPFASEDQPGFPVPTPPEIARLAVTTAAAFGLELYAIDIALCPDGPMVAAVTAFPDYAGVFGSDELVARYVVARCRAHRPARREVRVPA
jgi:glutathione synthase/RimK-type ligase-like ATP-grasp enzyme